LSSLRDEIIRLIGDLGHEKRDEPFTLSSGEISYDDIDGKRAIARGSALRTAAEAVLELASEQQVEFDAVGGLTMGADPLAHAIALLSDTSWFSVRKEPKRHGKQKLIEGCTLSPEMRVMVVDDVVTTGKSILQAIDAINDLDARVVLAVTLVDRGDAARSLMSAHGVPYAPLTSYSDLGIARVGPERLTTQSPR
jgi:orotate phosphoribosyltransferase